MKKIITLYILIISMKLFSNGYEENFVSPTNGYIQEILIFENNKAKYVLHYNDDGYLFNVENTKNTFYHEKIRKEELFLSSPVFYERIQNEKGKKRTKGIISNHVAYIYSVNSQQIKEDHYSLLTGKEEYSFSKFYIFDIKKRIIKSYILENGIEHSIELFLYNNENVNLPDKNLVEVRKDKFYHESNNMIKIIRITHLNDNKKVKEVYHNIATDKSVERPSIMSMEEHLELLTKNIYIFDDDGNVISYKILNSDNSVYSDYTYEYSYDSKMNWVKKVINDNGKFYKEVIREIIYQE